MVRLAQVPPLPIFTKHLGQLQHQPNQGWDTIGAKSYLKGYTFLHRQIEYQIIMKFFLPAERGYPRMFYLSTDRQLDPLK